MGTRNLKLTPLVEVLLRSECDFSHEELEETPGGAKQLWLETTVQYADKKNRNGRVYTRPVLEREVQRFQKHIDEGTSYGEADHPGPGQSPSATRQAVLWKRVWMEESGAVRGRGVVMDTHVGRDIKAILKAGGAIGTSSRGRGSVTLKAFGEQGEQAEVVDDNYRMRTFDLVIDQSVEDAQSRLTRNEQILMEQEGLFQEAEAMKLTLEELKKDHPKVYEALVAEVKAEGDNDVQERLQALLSEREGEIRAEVMESVEGGLDEETEARLSNLEALGVVVVEACKQAGLLEDVALSDEEAQAKIEEMRSEVKALKKQVAKLEATNADLTDKTEKTAVEEAATAEAIDHPLSEELTEALVESCADMTEFEAKKARIKKRFDALAERVKATPAPVGKGRTHLTEDGDPPKEPQKTEGELSAGQKMLQEAFGVNG